MSVAAAFSPDGTQVVTASADHTARIWSIFTIEVQALIDRARGMLRRELTAEERKEFFLD